MQVDAHRIGGQAGEGGARAPRPIGGRHRVFERLGWPRPAVVVGRAATGNRADPASERPGLTKVPEGPEGGHEHVPGEVLGILACETGDQHTMDGATEASVQLSERFAVTAGRSGDERWKI